MKIKSNMPSVDELIESIEPFPDKQARLAKWHRWFAWHPVKVGAGDWRWFEDVERRVEFYECMEYGYSKKFFRAAVSQEK